MNNEVENYNNEEFIEILTALGSNTKILINGSADFEIRHSWNNGSRISILLQKKKTVRAGTRKRSKLKYRFNYLCLYFNT